jgi:hypothetical protein
MAQLELLEGGAVPLVTTYGRVFPRRAGAAGRNRQDAGAAVKRRQRELTRRSAAYGVMRFIRQHSWTKAVKLCHSRRGWGETAIKIVRAVSDPRQCVYRGLYHCSNVWQCLDCLGGIVRPRMKFLQEEIERTRAAGGDVYLCTLTTSHGPIHSARKLVDLVRLAGRRMRQGKQWRAIQDGYGITQMVRTLEITYGRANGWHPHLHELIFTREPLAEHELATLKLEVWERWSNAVVKVAKQLELAVDPPSVRRGVVVQRSGGTAKYLAKMGLVYEVLLAPEKLGRTPGHRSHWQLARDAADTERAGGDPTSDLELWRDCVRALKGVQYMAMSPAMRTRFKKWVQQRQLELELHDGDAEQLPPERSEVYDGPLTEQLEGPLTGGAVVFEVPDYQWDDLLAKSHTRKLLLLRIAEDTGPPGCAAVLEVWGGTDPADLDLMLAPAYADRVRFWLRLGKAAQLDERPAEFAPADWDGPLDDDQAAAIA